MDSKWYGIGNVWPGNDKTDKKFMAPVKMHLKPL